MKRIISFSGGLGSYMAAQRVVDEFGAEDCTLLFTDTLTEDPDTYRFMDESAAHLGLTVTTIKDGRDIWGVFEDVKFMGNSRVDPCSRVLKRELARKWMEENTDPTDAVLYVGIGWDEIHRMDNITKHWAPFTVEAPLTEPPYLSRNDIIEHLHGIGIEEPDLYKLGFAHNNCGGFCIKTGQAQFLKLLKTMPERYAHHEKQQEKLFTQIKPHGFIRVTKNKKLHYLSLKEFREYVEGSGQVDMFDIGGCGCFV